MHHKVFSNKSVYSKFSSVILNFVSPVYVLLLNSVNLGDAKGVKMEKFAKPTCDDSKDFMTVMNVLRRDQQET